ncbi:MAG TPA: hemolysin family protein [Bacteroidales bacterium]|nr:hemolysin family protein [Bacteroidales bacterium]
MNLIILITVSLLLSAFFAGMESALLRTEESPREAVRKPDKTEAGITRMMQEHPSKYLAAMRTGKIMAASIAAISILLLLIQTTKQTGTGELILIIISILFTSLFIFIISQLVPLAIARVSPGFFMKYLSAVAMFFFLLLYPVTKVVLALFSGISRKNINEASLYVKAEIDEEQYMPQTSINTGKETAEVRPDKRLIRNILDLTDLKLREIMVPRTEIEAVPYNSSLSQIREKFISTRFSRILVYQDTIDNISGYFEVKDIFKNPDDITSIIRKLSVVPETMQASKLLKMFVEEKRSIALVVDEFGGTSGMITIEDLLEEIVGDIEDEHDSKDLVERMIRPDEYLLSGRLEIDYLNERYRLELPEGSDYETLAGMILYYNGSIPGNNETVRIGNLRIKILRASPTKIELVNLVVE